MRQRSEAGIPGLNPQNPVTHTLLELYTDYAVSECEIEGLENLEEVRKLHKEKKPVVWNPNHLSNLDALAIHREFERHGYKDVADRMIFLLGIRLLKNLGTRFFTNGLPTISVWPPTEEVHTPAEQKKKSGMLKASLRGAIKILHDGDHSLVVFMEGGRSRTGSLRKPYPQTIRYLRAGEVDPYVVALGICGTDDRLPVGAKIARRGPIKLIVEKPERFSVLTQDIPKDLGKHEWEKAAADIIMGRIAASLPPQYRGVYA